MSVGDRFVGSTACYSTQADLSEGLLLSSADYSDDGSLPDNGWQLRLVITHALIDAAVFGELAGTGKRRSSPVEEERNLTPP